MQLSRVCGVYSIYNNITKKSYVGSSVNANERWENHKRALRRGKHHSAPLQRAWNKCGEAAFRFSILTICLKKELLIQEQVFIGRLKGYAPSGYNASAKAGGVFIHKKKRKLAAAKCRQILSDKAKRQWADPIIKTKMLKGMNEAGVKRRGKHNSLSTRIKRSISCKKSWSDPTLLAQHSDMLNARWSEPKFRQKMKAIFENPEYRARLSKKHKERWTPEMRKQWSNKTKEYAPKYTFNGIAKTAADWAAHLKISEGSFRHRLWKGMNEADILHVGKLKCGRKGHASGLA